MVYFCKDDPRAIAANRVQVFPLIIVNHARLLSWPLFLLFASPGFLPSILLDRLCIHSLFALALAEAALVAGLLWFCIRVRRRSQEQFP